MSRLVIATNNSHKFKEISALIPANIQLVSLSEIGCQEDIPEDRDTLEGNAFQKANFVYKNYGFACFADDTGLETEALGGKPGVYSARYSEDIAPEVPKEKRGLENMRKLLSEMKNNPNRNAAFRTVICYIDDNGKTQYFEGKISGKIIENQRGIEGFGYDPVFVPDGYDRTFAEMPFELKNTISHRALATQKFIEFLKNQRI